MEPRPARRQPASRRNRAPRLSPSRDRRTGAVERARRARTRRALARAGRLERGGRGLRSGACAGDLLGPALAGGADPGALLLPPALTRLVDGRIVIGAAAEYALRRSSARSFDRFEPSEPSPPSRRFVPCRRATRSRLRPFSPWPWLSPDPPCPPAPVSHRRR